MDGLRFKKRKSELSVRANFFDVHIIQRTKNEFNQTFHIKKFPLGFFFLHTKLFAHFSSDNGKCWGQFFAQRSNFSTGGVSFSDRLCQPIFNLLNPWRGPQ